MAGHVDDDAGEVGGRVVTSAPMPGIWQVPPACGVAPAGKHAEQPVVAVGLHLAAIAHALLAAGGEDRAERAARRRRSGERGESSRLYSTPARAGQKRQRTQRKPISVERVSGVAASR